MKFLKFVSTVLILVLAYGFFFQSKQEFFSLDLIQTSLPYNDKWENTHELAKEQYDSIFHQEYTYFGKGACALSFQSKDQKYVIKFFKNGEVSSNWLSYIKKHLSFKKDDSHLKMIKTFDGYANAICYDKENSALVYVSLNPQEKKLPTIKIVDHLGKSFFINLNTIPFVVQYKVAIFKDELNACLAAGKIDLAKKKIEQIFSLYKEQYGKGLYDEGEGILKNNGFYLENPIHFDVSKLTFDPKFREQVYPQKKIDLFAHKIIHWVNKRHPHYKKDLTEFLKANYLE
ncbi:hypothetical protein BN1013_00036 [Candidatus Rubidus massiliensis]|nr:hypothetical protein BN1013_00036 [Candidatus Rubidus massiliensis]